MGHYVNTTEDSTCSGISYRKATKSCQSDAQGNPRNFSHNEGSLVKNSFTGSTSFDFILRRRMCTLHPSEVFTSKDSDRPKTRAKAVPIGEVHTFLTCTSLTAQWKLFTQACAKVTHNTNYPLDVRNLSS